MTLDEVEEVRIVNLGTLNDVPPASVKAAKGGGGKVGAASIIVPNAGLAGLMINGKKKKKK